MTSLRPFEGVEAGQALPPLALPISATFVVAGALATRDYHPVHHDLAAATAGGADDILVNILTFNGLVERFVTAWAGPAAFVSSVDIRLGASCHPGDLLTFTGQVTAKAPDSERWADIAFTACSDRGEHLAGTARVRLA